MAYLTDGKIGVNLTDVSSTISDSLGNTYTGDDGARYMYVKAGAAITQYDTVTVDEDFTASAATKAAIDDGHDVCFAQVAFATNQYGYVMAKGRPTIRVAGSCAADVALYTTSTAGVLDDSSTTTQSRVAGITIVSANGTTATRSIEGIATWPRSYNF